MTESELIHLLRELDRPLEPSGTFRDDLLAQLKSERERSNPSRVSGAANRSDRHEPDAPEIWASPANVPKKGKLAWAVAAFVTILATGVLTWWLAPGSTTQPPTATSPSPSSVPGTSAPPAEEGSGGVVEIRSPGTDDYQLLQQALDDNPGALLQLQAGTYDLGGETLTIPHGVTIRGSNGGSEARQTRIAGHLQIQATSPAHAGEEVVLSDLEIESTDPDHAAVLYGDHDEETLDRGGADLTIDNALIRQTGGSEALDIHAHEIDVMITSSVVSSPNGFGIYIFDRGDNTIDIRNNTVDFVNLGVAVWSDDSQRATTNTATRIIGNELRGGPLPPGTEANFTETVTGLTVSTRGPLVISNNTVEIPYGTSDPNGPAVGIAIYADVPHGSTAVTDNRLVGGELAEETTFRVGMRVGRDGGTYARNDLAGSWVTGVMVNSSGSLFEDNRLSEVDLTPQSEEPIGDLPLNPSDPPPVHWWLRAGADDNTITDNTFEELLIVDSGEENQYPDFFSLVER